MFESSSHFLPFAIELTSLVPFGFLCLSVTVEKIKTLSGIDSTIHNSYYRPQNLKYRSLSAHVYIFSSSLRHADMANSVSLTIIIISFHTELPLCRKEWLRPYVGFSHPKFLERCSNIYTPRFTSLI